MTEKLAMIFGLGIVIALFIAIWPAAEISELPAVITIVLGLIEVILLLDIKKAKKRGK